jgi:putative membrane protein
MLRTLRIVPTVPTLGAALVLVVSAVTPAACRSHEVTPPNASSSVAEGQAVPGAPAVAMQGHAGTSGQSAAMAGAAMGGSSGAAAAGMGTGGNSGAVHVATRAGAKPSALEEDPPLEPASILTKLHQTNLKEIEMGKMAEKDGNSKDVKSYGSTLVRDHTAADRRILAFAKVEHIDIPTAGEKGKEMEMKLESGPGFDTEFAKHMMQDHQHDIAEVTEVRDSTKDAKLKSLLSSLLPVLKKHEEIAQKIVDRPGKEQK